MTDAPITDVDWAAADDLIQLEPLEPITFQKRNIAQAFANHAAAAVAEELAEVVAYIEQNIRVQSSCEKFPTYWSKRRGGNTYGLEYAEAIERGDHKEKSR